MKKILQLIYNALFHKHEEEKFKYGEKICVYINGDDFVEGTIRDKFRRRYWDDTKDWYNTYMVEYPDGSLYEISVICLRKKKE